MTAGWKVTIDGEYTDGLIISPSTTVTNGKGVLYRGREILICRGEELGIRD